MEQNDTNKHDYIKFIQKMNTEMIEIQLSIISIVDENESIDALLDILDKYHVLDDKSKFHDFLNFFKPLIYSRKKTKDKNIIIDLLLSFKTQIVQTYTKEEIYFIFRYNTPILYHLYKNNIIDIDQILKSRSTYFYHFFLPEYIEYYGIEKSKEIIGDSVEKYKENLDQFKLNRNEYHSDLEVAKLIRLDDLDSFIDYISRTNMKLDSKIPYSIFEVDIDLHNYNNTLIEYAAVFESVKIFKYLYDRLETFPENLLTATIYGGNFEILHLLENKGIEPDNDALIRTIIKHRNNMFDYFISKYEIELDFHLIEESIDLYNFYAFNEILKRKNDYLTNINYVSIMLLLACASDIRILFNILYSIPDIDVNIKGEIFF